MKPCTGCKHDPSVTGFRNLCNHPFEKELFRENTPLDENDYPLCYRAVSDHRPAYIPGVAYRLTRTKGSSDKYGPCEVCGKGADSVYHLVQSRRYTTQEGQVSMTYYGTFEKFGHKECLVALT